MSAMTRVELIRSQEPGASSGSLTWVQGPKALGHPRLLSQATSRELGGKWGSGTKTGIHMEATTLATRLQHQAHKQSKTGPAQ